MLSVLGPGGKLSCFCIKVSINKQSTLSTSAPHSCSLPHTIIMYNREKDHFLRLWPVTKQMNSQESLWSV